MIKILVLSLLIQSPREQHTQALEAFDREDYGAAATILADLALTADPHTLDRGGLAIAAGNAWRFEYERTGDEQAICSGIELLRTFFVTTQDPSPDIAAGYWQLVDERTNDNIACKSKPSIPVPAPSLLAISTRRKIISIPLVSETTDGPRDSRQLKIAGAVLTASAGLGVGVLAGQAVAFAQRLETYRLADGHDPTLKARAKSVERWMIGTGVTACVALASGITLLAIAHRRAKVRPSLGGLTGKF